MEMCAAWRENTLPLLELKQAGGTRKMNKIISAHMMSYWSVPRSYVHMSMCRIVVRNLELVESFKFWFIGKFGWRI
jgi:hypothetical protein